MWTRRNPSTALDGIAGESPLMKPGVKLQRFFIKLVSKPSPKQSVLPAFPALPVYIQAEFLSMIIGSQANPTISKNSNGAGERIWTADLMITNYI